MCLLIGVAMVMMIVVITRMKRDALFSSVLKLSSDAIVGSVLQAAGDVMEWLTVKMARMNMDAVSSMHHPHVYVVV